MSDITELLDRLLIAADAEDKDGVSAIRAEMVEMRPQASDTDRRQLDRMIDKCTWAIQAIDEARKGKS